MRRITYRHKRPLTTESAGDDTKAPIQFHDGGSKSATDTPHKADIRNPHPMAIRRCPNSISR